ncbi:MAG: hypothetical protein PHC91_01060 [Eubacteriales bacterium]|nr:hypothetical protein [Eubacteriales bacterium]
MNIGIAVDGKDLNSIVTDKIKECKYLLIVNVKDHAVGEAAEIVKVTEIENLDYDSGIQIAEELIKHNCEASITGELEPAVFDLVADACITRYNGAGYPAYIALDLMEKRGLLLIRNREGTDTCDDSHHKH